MKIKREKISENEGRTVKRIRKSARKSKSDELRRKKIRK